MHSDASWFKKLQETYIVEVFAHKEPTEATGALSANQEDVQS